MSRIIDIFLHLDRHLNEWAASMGGWLRPSPEASSSRPDSETATSSRISFLVRTKIPRSAAS
jgi:hypothetical protein